MLSEAESQELAEDAHFDKLLRIGVLSLKRIGVRVAIEPTQFVGKAILSCGTIIVSPRRPKLFEDIADLATAYSLRQTTASALGRDEGRTALIALLLRSMSESASEGLPQLYSSSISDGSIVKGRILISQTIQRFSARGVNHRAVSRASARGIDDQLLAVIATILASLSEEFAIGRDSIKLLNTLVNVLGSEQTPLPVDDVIEQCALLSSRYADWPNLCRTLALAALFFKGELSIWDTRVDGSGGYSQFCNLDLLWEQAVFSFADRALQGSASIAMLHPLGRGKFSLFPGSVRTIDPDIGIYSVDTLTMIIDAKYSLVSAASNSDIYQVLAYMRRMRTNFGILVYLSERTWIENIGGDGQEEILAVGLSIADVHAAAKESLASEILKRIT